MSGKPSFHAGSLDGVPQLWVEVSLDPQWRATYRLVIQEGVPVIAEVRVFPRERGVMGLHWATGDKAGPRATAPPGGVRSTLLRRVPIPAIGQFAGRAIKVLAAVRGLPTSLGSEVGEIADLLELKHEGGKAQPSRSRRGRKGKGDEFYALVAQTYVTETEKRKPRPLEAIRKRHRLATVNQARTAVYRAREMGYLGGRQPGRVSGFLTDKAKTVLQRPKKNRRRGGRTG